MSKTEKSAIAADLMKRHGRSFCDEIGIRLHGNTPSPLFRWLVASLLFSARIGAPQAVEAARALSKAGWRTPERMASATWKERVSVLNRNGYARYDESTSRMLEETANILIERYGGDLRKLREKADGDVERCKSLLTEFKGIGPLGAEIFLREVQSPWDEFYPFADRKALDAGERLGLGSSAVELSACVARKDFPAFLTAIVRADLAKEIKSASKGAA